MAKKQTKKHSTKQPSGASMYTLIGTLIVVVGIICNVVAPEDEVFRVLSVLVTLFGAIMLGAGLGLEMAKTKK
jgi:sulfite exporter TauE/SafE